MKLLAASPLFIAVCLVSAADAQHATKPAAHPAAVLPPRPEPAPQKPEKKQEKATQKNSPYAGPASPQNLDRLIKLSPTERNKALSSLPPGRRAQIEAKLIEYQKIPPLQRARNLERLQRLRTLPPQKQAQVRASISRFATLPAPRHQVVQKQLNQMIGLSDSDRRALMNSEEFRSKFTPSEQQMIEDISLVTPRS